MAIDVFKRALIITATQFNQHAGGPSIVVSGLTHEAANVLQQALRAEPNVGANIHRFSLTEYQGLTMLSIHPRDGGQRSKLIGFLVSNLQLNDKKLSFTVNYPFNKILETKEKSQNDSNSSLWCNRTESS